MAILANSIGNWLIPLFEKIIIESFLLGLYFLNILLANFLFLSFADAFVMPSLKSIFLSKIGVTPAKAPALCKLSSAIQWLWPVPNT